MKLSRIVFIPTILGSSLIWARDERQGLPAAMIAQSIAESEESMEAEEVENFLTAKVTWDPEAMPEAKRSWILLNVPEDILEKMGRNEDQNGDPLLK